MEQICLNTICRLPIAKVGLKNGPGGPEKGLNFYFPVDVLTLECYTQTLASEIFWEAVACCRDIGVQAPPGT